VGLACAIAAQQSGDLAFGNFQSDAVQDMALAVIGVEALCYPVLLSTKIPCMIAMRWTMMSISRRYP